MSPRPLLLQALKQGHLLGANHKEQLQTNGVEGQRSPPEDSALMILQTVSIVALELVGQQDLCELVEFGSVFSGGVDDYDVALRGMKVGNGQSLVFLEDGAVDECVDGDDFAFLTFYFDYDG